MKYMENQKIMSKNKTSKTEKTSSKQSFSQRQYDNLNNFYVNVNNQEKR